MGTDEVIAEPALDGWFESRFAPRKKDADVSELSFLGLSGAVMRPGSKTSNRIDGLLTRMMEHPSSGKYRADLDANLDYLITSLQLDMIEMLAKDYTEDSDAIDESGLTDLAEPEPREEQA